MTDQPTLYLSNFASHGSPGHHGAGRAFSIMAFTPKWADVHGEVPALTPPGQLVQAFRPRRGDPSAWDEYRRHLIGLFAPRRLEPGRLVAASGLVVGDEDTLVCICRIGLPCHRWVAAELLHHSGWRVVLDSERLAEVTPVPPPPKPEQRRLF